MQGRLIAFLLILVVISCSEENLPAGIYDYQVERLLSSPSGSKSWTQIVNSSDCADSVFLYVQSIDDSLDFSRLTYQGSCAVFDTTYLGRANASSPSDSDLFTDSLHFQNGDFWLIKTITSELFTVEIEDVILRYRSPN